MIEAHSSRIQPRSLLRNFFIRLHCSITWSIFAGVTSCQVSFFAWTRLTDIPRSKFRIRQATIKGSPARIFLVVSCNKNPTPTRRTDTKVRNCGLILLNTRNDLCSVTEFLFTLDCPVQRTCPFADIKIKAFMTFFRRILDILEKTQY